MIELTIKGQTVPALGFGTWQLRGDACVRGITHALALGYRHIDTAQAYENEEQVGQGMRKAGVPREHIFLVSKVRTDNFHHDDTIQSTHESLKRLRTDYIDLMLMHWPNPDVPLAETLGALCRLQDEGNIRHIGVSNFSPALVEEASQYATIFCNQVKYHPYHLQDELVAQAHAMDYLLTAYSPLARGRVLTDPTLERIGAQYNKTPAQVVLRWLLQQNVSAIPKAASDEHRRANYEIFDFTLSDEEMRTIHNLGAQRGRSG
jgi:2,5-diketo-D-gluconate reductase B